MSSEKLPTFWLGGYSLNVAMYLPMHAALRSFIERATEQNIAIANMTAAYVFVHLMPELHGARSIGVRGDTRSSNTLPVSSPALAAAGGDSAIRSRFGISTRLRMPFYLIPGDLLLLSPVYFFSPATYTNMAVTSSNGGLIPWQQGWATRFGRFQFVLGRELGATFHGYGFDNTTVVPGATPGSEPRVVDFKSIRFDLPILELWPYRAFDTQQSSAVLIQLFAGAEVPRSTTVTWPPGAPGVKLETIYSIGLRLIFDWRRYF